MNLTLVATEIIKMVTQMETETETTAMVSIVVRVTSSPVNQNR